MNAVVAGLTCGNCRAPMRRLMLDGHYGARVEIDVCEACHLLWFDGTENVQLTGASLVELIDTMGRAQALAHHTLRADAGCARCGGTLREVHNRSRWGRSTQLACARARHGAYTTFAQFLADKGLARRLSSTDRAALLARGDALDCLGCGAPVAAGDERCRHCGALPALFDVARLARALDPEEAIDPQPVHAAEAERRSHDCPACGGPVAATHMLRCAQCGATLALTRLAQAAAAVQPLADALRRAAAKPSPRTVARRLAAIDADRDRRRAWIAEMQASAERDAAATGGWGGSDDTPRDRRLARWAVMALAGLLGLMWLLA